MSAIIKCSNAIKEEIKSYCLSEIGALMESIREGADAVTAKVHDDGLEIAFPIGEIYGYTSDYVQALPNVFKELKKKHPDIAVRGIAYEYETVSEATFGPYFYCAAEDKDLTVTFEWQECAVCGNIIETDACYNSSQHDFGEGNLLCLCSPTCMLEYALSKEHGEVPRCVFLYRVFEYGANHHYQPLINPTTYDPKDAIEYYYTKIFDHKYTPLYYLAYGKVRFDSENSEVKVIRRSKCRNYISVLKREAHLIVDEWSRHDYLKDKRLGEIIYNTGRCAAAHGTGGRGMARYDYDVNYKHINDVNIVLELIARYIIDQLNPDLRQIVSTKQIDYIQQSGIGI